MNTLEANSCVVVGAGISGLLAAQELRAAADHLLSREG
jgi:monoamine oxidase